MTAEGDARRALIGPAAVERAREVAATAPVMDQADWDALTVLMRPTPTTNAPDRAA